MKEKEVSIIGGADGPTSIFIAGRPAKKSLKEGVRKCIYNCRRKRAEKGIRANPHTLRAVAVYAVRKYDAAELPKAQKRYKDQYKGAKESLIIMHRPELLGDLGEIKRPETFDEESLKEMYRRIQLRSEMAANIPDHEMPMDFHVYEIKMKEGHLEMEMDFRWDFFSVSYSAPSKKTMKKLKKISRELYMYYGVSKEDIKNRTERYLALLTVLSSKSL
ncbi:MAG: sodium ion-translocating decarboxylase subunit beta [Coprococcus sp.]|nr:sodium ion-translocating decarboxylase subunit beta [Coprococcus sp.]